MTRIHLALPRAFLVALVALANTGIAAAADAPTASPNPRTTLTSDALLSTAVERRLARDALAGLALIRVTAKDGVVTLTGDVDSLRVGRRAGALAETVPGVRLVDNRLAVAPTASRDDDAVADDIHAAFRIAPGVEADNIDVTVDDGDVVLEGEVDSWPELRLVERIALGIRGVRNLDDRLDVRQARGERPEGDIRRDVVRALEWDALVDADPIDVNVWEGAVNLTGAVDTAAERSRARALAFVRGVRSVDASGLRVTGRPPRGTLPATATPQTTQEEATPRETTRTRPAREGTPERVTRESTAPAKTAKASQQSTTTRTTPPASESDTVLDDRSLRRAIRDALGVDPTLGPGKIEVRLEDGVATLHGEVDTLLQKQRAATAARRTTGVDRVVNRIEVRPVTPEAGEKSEGSLTPAIVVHDVKRALNRDADLSSFAIDVEAGPNGEVTLTGTVDSYYRLALAEDAAASVPGVKHVRADLDITQEHPSFRGEPYADTMDYTDRPWYPEAVRQEDRSR